MTRRAPNTTEHSARLVDPAAFEGGHFRSKTISPGVRLILGKRPGSSTTETQAIRFGSDRFGINDVWLWLRRHDYNAIAVEPATEGTGYDVGRKRQIDEKRELPGANPSSSTPNAGRSELSRPGDFHQFGVIPREHGDAIRSALYAVEVRSNRARLAWDEVVKRAIAQGATPAAIAGELEHGPHQLIDTAASLADGAGELVNDLELLAGKLRSNPAELASNPPIGDWPAELRDRWSSIERAAAAIAGATPALATQIDAVRKHAQAGDRNETRYALSALGAAFQTIAAAAAEGLDQGRELFAGLRRSWPAEQNPPQLAAVNPPTWTPGRYSVEEQTTGARGTWFEPYASTPDLQAAKDDAQRMADAWRVPTRVVDRAAAGAVLASYEPRIAHGYNPEQLEPDVRRAEQSRARRWFSQLRPDERGDLGDALVLDTFDFREWGFERRPSGAFLAEIDRLRMAWESENPTRVLNPAGDGAFAVNPLDDVAERQIERAHRRGRHAAVVELRGRRYLATVPASRMSAAEAKRQLGKVNRAAGARIVAWRPYKGNPADVPTASLHLREAGAHLDTAAGALASNPPKFVQIGTARQLDAVDGRRYSWKVREAWPVFVPEGAEQLPAGAGRIYIVRPTGASAPSDPPAPGTRASDTFREWHAFDPSEQYRLDVPAVVEFGPAVGVAYCIIYRSDKYGDGMIDYDHKFKADSEPTIAVVGTLESPRAILLRGGAFRITRRGIVD